METKNPAESSYERQPNAFSGKNLTYFAPALNSNSIKNQSQILKLTIKLVTKKIKNALRSQAVPMQISTQIDVPAANTRLLLTHGAGAGMPSPFMSAFTQLIANLGISVTGLDFDYIHLSHLENRRRPPPPVAKLADELAKTLDDVCPAIPEQNIIIGGKSMGGRVASMVAAGKQLHQRVNGCVCLGYPFHPPRKRNQWRTEHLAGIALPCLIIQGERDPFGTYGEVMAANLPPSIALHWLKDGDHDFKPRKTSGITHRDNLETAAKTVAEFADSLADRD